jgi:Methylamine utilisation protein MauE
MSFGDAASILRLFVALVLVTAAITKTVDGLEGRSGPSAVHALVSQRFASAFVAVLVLWEITLVALLLVPATSAIGSLASAAFFVGSLLFLIWARRQRPGESCGCFGSRWQPRDHVRSVALSSYLLAASVVSLGSRDPWWSAGPQLGLAAGIFVAAVVGAGSWQTLREARAALRTARTLTRVGQLITLAREAAADGLVDELLSDQPTRIWRRGLRTIGLFEALRDDRVVRIGLASTPCPRCRPRMVVVDGLTHTILHGTSSTAELVLTG